MEDSTKLHEACARDAAHIVSAYGSLNKLGGDEISPLLREIYEHLLTLRLSEDRHLPMRRPAVPIEKSITADYLICLEDGKKCRMLKRYLRTHFKLTPEEYRARWRLPPDYPMTSPNYTKKRSKIAKTHGLGKGVTSTRRARARRKPSDAKVRKAKASDQSKAERMIAREIGGRRILPTL